MPAPAGDSSPKESTEPSWKYTSTRTRLRVPRNRSNTAAPQPSRSRSTSVLSRRTAVRLLSPRRARLLPGLRLLLDVSERTQAGSQVVEHEPDRRLGCRRGGRAAICERGGDDRSALVEDHGLANLR